MRFLRSLSFFLVIPSLCWAIDVKPWINDDVEVEIRADMLFQYYDSIQTPRRNYKHNAKDYFWSLSAAFPFRKYKGEFEFTTAHTHHQNFRVDNMRVSWAYLWLNDLEGDYLSLMPGIIITEPFSRALHDLSSFHHGHIEGEFYLSIGKQFDSLYGYGDYFRCWNVCGIGGSDVGSCWMREDIACEWCGYFQSLRLFAHSLWGFGQQDLRRLHHFKGYGRIKHRSVDIGVRYGFSFDYLGTLNVQYARRVYAENFPQHTNLVLLEYYLPFGYQDPCLY